MYEQMYGHGKNLMLLMPSGWGINILKRTKVRGLE
jgi:hypothetical protein